MLNTETIQVTLLIVIEQVFILLVFDAPPLLKKSYLLLIDDIKPERSARVRYNYDGMPYLNTYSNKVNRF